MIINRQNDGIEQHQYEVNDRVIILRTMQRYFLHPAIKAAERCTVRRIQRIDAWYLDRICVHFSDDWPLADCLIWMLQPHPETLATAQVIRLG